MTIKQNKYHSKEELKKQSDTVADKHTSQQNNWEEYNILYANYINQIVFNRATLLQNEWKLLYENEAPVFEALASLARLSKDTRTWDAKIRSLYEFLGYNTDWGLAKRYQQLDSYLHLVVRW